MSECLFSDNWQEFFDGCFNLKDLKNKIEKLEKQVESFSNGIDTDVRLYCEDDYISIEATRLESDKEYEERVRLIKILDNDRKKKKKEMRKKQEEKDLKNAFKTISKTSKKELEKLLKEDDGKKVLNKILSVSERNKNKGE